MGRIEMKPCPRGGGYPAGSLALFDSFMDADTMGPGALSSYNLVAVILLSRHSVLLELDC
jgi:hypothetical protein